MTRNSGRVSEEHSGDVLASVLDGLVRLNGCVALRRPLLLGEPIGSGKPHFWLLSVLDGRSRPSIFHKAELARSSKV